MFNFFFKLTNNRLLIKNFTFLSILQISNLLIPILTYPYLIRVLGKEVFGLIIFAQSIIGYFVVLVNFGFNLSATKEISQYRNDINKLNEIASSVLIIKAILFICALLLTVLMTNILPQAKENATLFYLTLWMCIYEFIFPIWYFQGKEEMKYLTYITILSRFLFLILIFVFVKKNSDYLLVPVFYGLGAITSGLFSLFIMRTHGIRFNWQPIYAIKYYFLESVPIFFSNLSTVLSLTSNKIILGLFVGMNEVAYYELADKLSTIIKTPIQLIGQVLYPRIAFTKDKNLLRKSFFLTMLISIVLLLFSILTSHYLILILGGGNMIESSNVFTILIFSIIPVTISLFYSNLVLTIWGHNKEFLISRLYMNIFYFMIILVLFFTKNINLITLSISVFLSECFIGLFSVYICNRKKINFLVRTTT